MCNDCVMNEICECKILLRLVGIKICFEEIGIIGRFKKGI